MKINFRLIWNYVVGLASLYLATLTGFYLIVCIDDGFGDTARCCSLDDVWLFITMMAILIVLINPIGLNAINQVKKVIKKQQTATKKVTNKK